MERTARIFLCSALLVAIAAGCGSKAPPPAKPAPAADPNDAQRHLTSAECQSLGEWIADACHNKGNERSARVEGWCSDIVSGLEHGTWVTDECLKHVRYMDSMCFRGTSNVHNMMDCDREVDRQ